MGMGKIKLGDWMRVANTKHKYKYDFKCESFKCRNFNWNNSGFHQIGTSKGTFIK